MSVTDESKTLLEDLDLSLARDRVRAASRLRRVMQEATEMLAATQAGILKCGTVTPAMMGCMCSSVKMSCAAVGSLAEIMAAEVGTR